MDTVRTGNITLTEAERAGLAWLKAQSSAHNGACVEIAESSGKIAMRDSKDPDGPILVYTPAEFRVFVDAIKETRT